MGNSSSVPSDYREQHWGRDMGKLFTSNKITDSLDFEADFMAPLRIPNDDSSPPLYIFVSREGRITALSHILPEIKFQLIIPDTEFIHLDTFSPSSLLLTTSRDIVMLVTYEKEELKTQEIPVSNTKFCLRLDDHSFIAISKNSGTKIINIADGTQTTVWEDIDNSNPTQAVLLPTHDPSLLICANELIIGKIQEHSQYKILNNITSVKKIILLPNGSIIFTSGDCNTALQTKVNVELNFDEPKMLYESKNEIIDLLYLYGNTFVFCTSNEIHLFSDDQTKLHLQSQISNSYQIKTLMNITEPRIFVAICTEGNIIACRVPSPKRTDLKKGDLETCALFNFHRCEIILGCTAEEFSFLTFDERHIAVLWESFPDWWNAPYYLRMFDASE